MPRYCRICGRHRADERFGGRGKRRYTCKDCLNKPKADRQRIEHRDEILRYLLRQSRISPENLERLAKLAASTDGEIAGLARLVRDVGLVRPNRRRRIRYLYHEKRNLFDRLMKAGALEELETFWDDMDYEGIEAMGDLDPFDDQDILVEYYRRNTLRGSHPGTSGSPDVTVYEDEAFLREFYSAASPLTENAFHLISQPDLEFAFDPDEVPF